MLKTFFVLNFLRFFCNDPGIVHSCEGVCDVCVVCDGGLIIGSDGLGGRGDPITNEGMG